MFNILTEPLIRMDTATDSRVPATLPEVYAALMADSIDSFPALRPHQRHAWHAFLVQLGALALHRAGRGEPPAAAAEWCELIHGLTPGYENDEPWQLVVEDITKPAFMQPPASVPGKLAEYKSAVETPDELDMLVTSKNHDLKAAITSSATINDWLFAVITLQTAEGFGGAGNYGISRMNGGLGCRPAFTLAPALGPEIHTVRPGIHVRRDIGALVECREELLNEYPMYPRDGGVRLLWDQPWDGTKVEAFPLSDLDPFYIEICRRIRLQADPTGRVSALRATSKAARIEAKALKGVTGDPWTPINTKESKSLTLPGGGFTYKKTVDYLSADWQSPRLFKLTAAERRSPQDMLLVARGMVRGQGKTEGYHERTVPFRKDVLARAFGRAGGLEKLGEIARQRIEEVGKVQGILRHAVSVFAAGGSTDSVSKEHRARANPWANKLDEIVDTTFFDVLQTEFDAAESERKGIRSRWLMNDDKDGVVDHARQILQDAEDSLPCPAIQRYRARVRADSVFEGRIRGPSGLPFLFDDEGGK